MNKSLTVIEKHVICISDFINHSQTDIYIYMRAYTCLHTCILYLNTYFAVKYLNKSLSIHTILNNILMPLFSYMSPSSSVPITPTVDSRLLAKKK